MHRAKEAGTRGLLTANVRAAIKQRDEARNRMLSVVAVSQRQAHAIVSRLGVGEIGAGGAGGAGGQDKQLADTPRMAALKVELQTTLDALRLHMQALALADAPTPRLGGWPVGTEVAGEAAGERRDAPGEEAVGEADGGGAPREEERAAPMDLASDAPVTNAACAAEAASRRCVDAREEEASSSLYSSEEYSEAKATDSCNSCCSEQASPSQPSDQARAQALKPTEKPANDQPGGGKGWGGGSAGFDMSRVFGISDVSSVLESWQTQVHV